MAALNPQQTAAIQHLDTPLLVLAGAGSGKTRVITHKIAWLIQEAGYKPHHIAAVTFTNKAAREMKTRVSKLLSGKDSRGLTVSTFHTLGLTLLRRESQALGYKASLSILDAQDCVTLLRELHDKNHPPDKATLETLQYTISHWKNALISPEHAQNIAENDTMAQQARLYARYQTQLKAYNAVDFDDLIKMPVELFQAEPAILHRWQARLRYLLIDEYQDTNTSQYQLVKLLAGHGGALTVVGDDDQSIYAWRGAQPENLSLLQQDFPNLTVIKLEQNYRSSNRILRIANHLIAHNPHTFVKRLWSDKGMGDMVRVLATRNEEHEAEKVVGALMTHQFRYRTDYGDYAILYRGNHQARPFEKLLRERNIPYYISGGTSFFALAEVKDIMAYLRLIVNQKDDSAFVRIANVPRRELGPSTLEKLGAYANEHHLSLFEACFAPGFKHCVNSRILDNVQQFAHWIAQLADRAQREEAVKLAKEVVAQIHYQKWLLDTCKDKRTAERRYDNVNDLLEWLGTIQERDGKNLSELVAHIALLDVIGRQEEQDKQGSVALMTLHAAKGLEFPHVFMVGMEEDLLPHHNSTTDAHIQEERRLAYVGITRAQKTLTLSLAQQRKRYHEVVQCEPSRFLQELPAEDLEWEGKAGNKTKSRAEQQAVGSAHLAHMRALLKSK